jgi:hypothetical protein
MERPFKLIIAGSRELNPGTHAIDAAILRYPMLTGLLQSSALVEIVSGTARGIDALGETWAKKQDTQKFGKRAGLLRNEQMAEYADALLLIWDGESRGSKNMLFNMKKLGKQVFEVKL